MQLFGGEKKDYFLLLSFRAKYFKEISTEESTIITKKLCIFKQCIHLLRLGQERK